MVVMRSVGVGPMPLKSAKLPSPCRKKRSIGIMRSMALSSAGGGTRLRAVNTLRSGKRSTSNSIRAPGLRLIWPPSGRIWRASSSESRLLAARIWRCWRAIRSGGLGGAQVAQPAEAEERGRPVLGRRGHLEGGAGIAGDDLAREREAAGVDFACPGCIAGPQVLRRDGDAVRFAEGKWPVDDGMRGDAAGDPAKEATRQEHGQWS